MAFTPLRPLDLLIGNDTMPDRLVPASQKGSDYHGKMARWCISTVNTHTINKFRAHIDVNRRFVAGEQWIFREDLDTFLMDTSEDARNRLRVKFNVCATVWNKYRGTAAQMAYKAGATPVTQRTLSRREARLQELLTMQQVAMTSPQMLKALQSQHPLGDTPAETVGIHGNTWRDGLVKAHEHLLRAVASLNEFGLDDVQDADDMVVSGLNAHLSVGNGADFDQRRVDPELFIWDTNATRYDLSDGFFAACAPHLTPSQIYKRWQPSQEVIQHIEDVLRIVAGANETSGLINVLQTYWKDIMFQEYGYVKGLTGDPELVPINYLPPGSGKDAKPKYTRDDRVEPPDNEENNRLFRGEKSTNLKTEIVRFCDMIPYEYLCGNYTPPQYLSREGMASDIVLDEGVYSLQPYDPYQVRKVQLPLQASCYAVERGEIIAPMTDIIFPQRFYNRVMSVSEQQMNNSGSRSPAYNADMLDETITPDEADRKFKRGEVVRFRTMGMPVQNAMGVMDTTPSAGTINYFQVGQQIVEMMRLISATPQPVTGQSEGEGLVRTTQMLIQQAGVLDEPVYSAIARAKLQRFQIISTAGKEFYLQQRTDILSDLVSEPDMLRLMLTRDYELERFSIKVTRTNTEEVDRTEANALILQFFQMGLLGQQQVADLFNQATPDDVRQAMQEYTQDLMQAQKQQAQMQQKAMVGQQIAARDQQLNDQAQMAYEHMVEATMNKDNNDTKLKSNYTREHARSMFAPDQHVEAGGPER